jgi:hypothetical protein
VTLTYVSHLCQAQFGLLLPARAGPSGE